LGCQQCSLRKSGKTTVLQETILVIKDSFSKPEKESLMPTPKQPLSLPPEISPHIRELFDKLLVIARDHRTTQLVDYLCDLRLELFWVADELAELDFDAFAFLHALADDGDNDDGDNDCDGPEPAGVH
jgi:hypothetical protein